MYSPKLWCVLLGVSCIAPGSLAFAQSAQPADDSTATESTAKAAAENDVRQLRREVVELQAQIQRLVQAGGRKEPGEAHLVPVSDVVASSAGPESDSGSTPVTRADIDALQKEIDAL